MTAPHSAKPARKAAALTRLQNAALAALRDGTWQAYPTLRYQGIKWRTLDSLHDRGLVDRGDGYPDRIFRFRINEAGRDAHYRRTDA